MTSPFRSPRPCSPGHVDRCVIFQWIGQSFSYCDGCGRPRWEHLYDPPYGGARPLFHVKQRNYNGWFWEPVGSLIDPLALRE